MGNPVIKRVVIVVLLTVPIAWLWWSLGDRLPKINKSMKIANTQFNKLEIEISKAEYDWSEIEVIKAKKSLNKVKKKLIGNYESLAGWLEEVNAAVEFADYKAGFKVGEMELVSEDIEGISVTPVKMTLIPKTQKGKKGYVSYLNLLRRILERRFGVDLIEVNMTGGDKGVKQMDVLFHVLVGFDKKNIYDRSARGIVLSKCGKNVFCVEGAA